MPATEGTVRQWALIHNWLVDLRESPGLDLVWLDGSLAGQRGIDPCLHSVANIRIAGETPAGVGGQDRQ